RADGRLPARGGGRSSARPGVPCLDPRAVVARDRPRVPRAHAERRRAFRGLPGGSGLDELRPLALRLERRAARGVRRRLREEPMRWAVVPVAAVIALLAASPAVALTVRDMLGREVV